MEIQFTIIDDNKQDIEKVESSLNKVFDGDILKLHKVLSFREEDILDGIDAYILDIDMPNETGFEVARKIYDKQPNARIVFCTHHNDLVYRSFSFSPFYFLRKSNLEEDMNAMAIKLKAQLKFKYILHSRNNETYRIPVENILYIETYRNDSEIYLMDKTVVKIRKPLKDFGYLTEYTFCRINKSQMVNFNYVKSIKSSTVYLLDGKEFPVSRKFKNEIIYNYKKYLMEK